MPMKRHKRRRVDPGYPPMLATTAAKPAPPSVARDFSIKQLEVLAILADDIRRSGQCRRLAAKIAETADCARDTVYAAVRAAKRVGLLEDAHGMRGTQMWLDYLRLTTGHRAALWRRVEAERDRVWQDELNRREVAKAAQRTERAAERRLEGPGDPDDQRAA
jgi:hypothetical protein